jgi:hypothetical protein
MDVNHEPECPVLIDGFRATCCCKEIRKAQARALREAAKDLASLPSVSKMFSPWLEKRADRIERGEA